ncbi:MAG TPA: hypothetical protein VGQ17_08615 [Gemmatimonadales bacterium]|jgi:hypothetical protein|nr:hypothetical protein [Gemmatimonadales bacterium]
MSGVRRRSAKALADPRAALPGARVGADAAVGYGAIYSGDLPAGSAR